MRSQLNIVHLEDDPHDSELVNGLLSEEGIACNVVRVETQADFVAAIEQGSIDLILADYSLPSFDGISALEIALRLCPQVPFILLSGTGGEELAAETLKSGATDYVFKERPSRIVPSVRRALREAEARTERFLAEERLRKSEERLRTVIQDMPALMAAFDPQGNIIAWNRECERVTGYSAREIVGNPQVSELLFTGTERERFKAEWCFPEQDYRDRELELVARDRTLRAVSWSNISRAFPVPGWASWAIGIDFTERRQAQAEQERMQTKLLQMQKLESLGVLAGGIAHDFNNLLTGIMGNAGLALGNLEPGSPVRSAIERVIRASERAAELTGQMLAYAGKANFEIQPIDLSQHISETVTLLTSAMSKNVLFQLALGENLPTVEVDRPQLHQLVMNLVMNGAEACSDGPGTVRISTGLIMVDEAQRKELLLGEELSLGLYVFLDVQDTGCGMDDETKMRIFDPFFTTKFTGRGLGLSAALGIVRAHRGSLIVESVPGKGSTFRVLLPASNKPVAARRQKGDRDLTGHGLILAVDDEPFVLQVAKATLERYGYKVITAKNGREGVELFRKRAREIDLVLLDMTMPELNGEETLTAIRAIRPDVIAVLSSGYDEIESTSRFLGKGLAGFIQKPYTPEGLASKVKDALQTQAPQEQRAKPGAQSTS